MAYFAEQLPGHYRAEMFLGPHRLIPTVTANIQLIAQLIDDAEQPVRRDLLAVGTAYAALLGWLHQDAGDLYWSGRWRATCYSRIGGDAARDGVALWDRILGTMPDSARRDNAIFWVRQAAALAVAGEPERVVEIATIAAGLARETGSARLRRELLALPGRATGWQESAHGRELGEIINEVLALTRGSVEVEPRDGPDR